MTSLACPGGTSVKWMPRRVPAFETEQFAWVDVEGATGHLSECILPEPLQEQAALVGGARIGVTSKAPATDSSRTSTGAG